MLSSAEEYKGRRETITVRRLAVHANKGVANIHLSSALRRTTFDERPDAKLFAYLLEMSSTACERVMSGRESRSHRFLCCVRLWAGN